MEDTELFEIAFDNMAMAPILGAVSSFKLIAGKIPPLGIREWAPGDSLRDIHRAKTSGLGEVTGKTYVHVSEKKRTPSARVVADLSGSGDVAYAGVTKKSVIKSLAYSFARSAAHSGAEVKALAAAGNDPFLTRSFLTPETAMRELDPVFVHGETPHAQTNLEAAFELLTGDLRERRSLVVVVSDFISPPGRWRHAFETLGASHSVIAIVVRAPLDEELPPGFYRKLVGAESGQLHACVAGGESICAECDEALADFARAGLVELLSVNLRDDRGAHNEKLRAFFENRNHILRGA